MLNYCEDILLLLHHPWTATFLSYSPVILLILRFLHRISIFLRFYTTHLIIRSLIKSPSLEKCTHTPLDDDDDGVETVAIY